MAAPARTSLEKIVAAGRHLVETGGLDALTMQAVATAVGIRAPSIYKRVRDRNELVRLVAEDVARDLGAALEEEAEALEPRAGLYALLARARDFANAHPHGYALIYAPLPEAARPDRVVLARASAGLLAMTTALVGEEHALPAARMVVAWLHGFVTMELAGDFRLGGDVDEAFRFGADRLVGALAAGESVSALGSREAGEAPRRAR